MKIEKFNKVAREIFIPKEGIGLVDDLKRARGLVREVDDFANNIGERMMEEMERRRIGCLVLVSNDWGFLEVVREARMRHLMTVVIGDEGGWDLKRNVDVGFSWRDVVSGKARCQAASGVGKWKDNCLIKFSRDPKIAFKTLHLFKPIRTHAICCKMTQSFTSFASPLREPSSSDEDEMKVSGSNPNEEINVRFANAVSNIFKSCRLFENKKRTCEVAPKKNIPNEETCLFRSCQVFDNEKNICNVKPKKNTSNDEMGPVTTKHFDVPKVSCPASAYNKMMRAFSRAGKVNEVIRLFQEMKRSECKPNVLCYNTIINALVMYNRTLEARVVFKEIITSGLVPIVSSYNILVKLYCRLEKLDMAYKVIDSMLKCGCKPDSITFSTLISGLCWVGKFEEAWKVLDWMLENRCCPTVHTYTPIIRGYCLDGRIDDAEILMGIMENAGCPPSYITYNILIDGLCKVENFDAVERIIRESEAKGWKPNADTYNAYMNGLCKRGKHTEAVKLLEIMQRDGLEPTDISLSIYLDCLCRDSRIWEAKCLLDNNSELKWRVTVVGYNTLLSRLSEIASSLEVLSLFTDMLKKGIAPNTRTFNIVINSLCKGGKLMKAKCVFNSRWFVANCVTYNTLIHWCFQNQEADEAEGLFYRMMTAEKIAPDTITYTIMVVGLCFTKEFSKATKLFLISVKGNFDQDLVTGLINKLFEQERFEELSHLYEGMTNYFFEGSCQNVEIFNICVILGKILKKHSVRNFIQ